MIILRYSVIIIIVVCARTSSSRWSYSLRISNNIILLWIELLHLLLLILNSWCWENTLIYNYSSFIASIFIQIVTSGIWVKYIWIDIVLSIFRIWLLRSLQLLASWDSIWLLLILLTILCLLHHGTIIICILHHALFWFHQSGNWMLIIILLKNKFLIRWRGSLLMDLLLLL